MIVSAFSNLTKGLIGFFNDDSLGSNKNPVEYSIIKEDYIEYIKNFNIKGLILPTEDEAREAYESKKESLHKFQLWAEVMELSRCKIRNIYKIDKGEFIYLGQLEFLTGRDTGVSKYSMEFFNAVYYSYVYLKKPINTSYNLDKRHPLDSFIPNLKKRFQEAREVLGRISLYKEAFKKLDMPEDLELCISNENHTLKVLSMIVFLIKLIEQMNL